MTEGAFEALSPRSIMAYSSQNPQTLTYKGEGQGIGTNGFSRGALSFPTVTLVQVRQWESAPLGRLTLLVNDCGQNRQAKGRELLIFST